MAIFKVVFVVALVAIFDVKGDEAKVICLLWFQEFLQLKSFAVSSCESIFLWKYKIALGFWEQNLIRALPLILYRKFVIYFAFYFIFIYFIIIIIINLKTEKFWDI